MKRPISFQVIALAGAFFVLQALSCRHEANVEEQRPQTGYPAYVESIITTRCNTPGCHTSQSKDAAGGLSLETWEQLFEGSRGGSAVIPYRADYSTLLYYTNTDASRGITLLPTMPYNAPPLSAAEYNILEKWIIAGAPDKNGYVKFSEPRTERSHLYVCNKGCDVVTVMDAEKGLAMRYVSVGKTNDVEGPSTVRVSPDKQYWYVVFNAGTVIQKFRVADNMLVAELDLGVGMWNSVSFSHDSKKLFVTDNQYNGKVAFIDAEQMKLVAMYSTDLRYPVSSCVNKAGTYLYVTSGESNYIFKINITNPTVPVISRISLETGKTPADVASLNPYAVVLNADGSRYYVSCRLSSELRIMQTSNDSLIATIPLGSNPAQMYFSGSTPYLFISCPGVPGSAKQSAVYVIDHHTNTYVTNIYAGHESRGLVMDETAKKLYVANRNVSAGGPAAHHASLCAGKNGYITVIDVNQLKLVSGYKKELSVDPYDLDLIR